MAEDTPPYILEQLAGRSWDELGVLEHAGHLLFPEKIYRRTKSGQFEARAVCIRVPREPDRRKARVQARLQAAEEGIDPEKDADLFEDMENMTLLWMAIRNNTHPYEPLTVSPHELEATYDKRSLMHAWGVVDGYAQLLDPRPEQMTANELLYLVAAIAKGRDIRPLRAFGSAAQAHCIVSMAGQLMSFWESKSSLEPSAPLTPDSSASSTLSALSEEPTLVPSPT